MPLPRKLWIIFFKLTDLIVTILRVGHYPLGYPIYQTYIKNAKVTLAVCHVFTAKPLYRFQLN